MVKVNFFNINEEEARRQYGAASGPGNPSIGGKFLPKKLCRRGYPRRHRQRNPFLNNDL
jgi:hypothetical protein